MKCVVLLSGGIDSATVLAIAKEQLFSVHAISFSYGQKHSSELKAAVSVADQLMVDSHRVIEIDLHQFGGSALTADLPVPKHDSVDQLSSDIPITYVPARNTIFLAYALAWSEVLGAADIFIGVNALDYSGYPDCRPEYIEAFNTLANLATKAAVEGQRVTIHTPLIQWTKAQTIRRGLELGVDYGLTVSCYEADEQGAACGHCDSCLLRMRGFAEAGYNDPTKYICNE